MQVVASEEVRELVAERGGRLYVSVRAARCCGGGRTLRATTEVERPEAYRVAGRDKGLEVLVPRVLAQLPEELHVVVRRFPRRVEAYWNGCAYVA